MSARPRADARTTEKCRLERVLSVGSNLLLLSNVPNIAGKSAIHRKLKKLPKTVTNFLNYQALDFLSIVDKRVRKVNWDQARKSQGLTQEMHGNVYNYLIGNLPPETHAAIFGKPGGEYPYDGIAQFWENCVVDYGIYRFWSLYYLAESGEHIRFGNNNHDNFRNKRSVAIQMMWETYVRLVSMGNNIRFV